MIPAGGRDLPERVEAIRFEKVTFSYPVTAAEPGTPLVKPPALCEVDVTIPVGRVVALVGRNGSGKTTLAKLLCGLYTGLRADPLGRRRRGRRRPAADHRPDRPGLAGRLPLAVHRAGQRRHRPPRRLPDGRTSRRRRPLLRRRRGRRGPARGWDTLLGRGYKGGHEISGGQWQRLQLSRAQYRDARILIVDEPTSALDAQAEQRVFDLIRELAADGQTVVLITHRLHSVRHADVIYVLDRGRVVEHGAFADLMRPGAGTGDFREMYLLQSRQYQHPEHN